MIKILNVSVFLFLFSFSNKKNYSFLEINNYIGKGKNIDALLDAKFFRSDSTSRNLTIFFKYNYRLNGNSLSFCSIPVVDCWVFKLHSKYNFIILLDKNSDFFASITKYYGKHDIETQIEVNDVAFPISCSWNSKDVKITIRDFLNMWKIPKYSNCVLVTIGNMEFKDIIHLKAGNKMH
jgi:hypothetical protein